MKTIILHSSLVFVMASCSAMAKPNKDTHQHVRVQTYRFEVSQKSLTQLLVVKQPLYPAVKRLMEAGDAKLHNTTFLVCQSGYKAVSESIREVIYPTEYEPPELPSSIGYSGGNIGGQQFPPHPNLTTPTAFETRNVGEILEIEAVIKNQGKQVDLRVVQETVTHPKDNIWYESKEPWGTDLIIFPEFEVQRTTSNVILLNNKHRLISTYTPHDKEGKLDPSRKILVFVKATVITP